MALTKRELSLVKAAFSVGWFRALSDAQYTNVFTSTQEETHRECLEWLAENARSDHSLNVEGHLDQKFERK